MHQPDLFPDGDDLPLFTGAPVRVEIKPFNPQPTSSQPALFDLRPQFGANPADPIQPSQELCEDDSQL